VLHNYCIPPIGTSLTLWEQSTFLLSPVRSSSLRPRHWHCEHISNLRSKCELPAGSFTPTGDGGTRWSVTAG